MISANLKNTMGTALAGPEVAIPLTSVVCADNLEFMQKLPACCCDLVYVDPPFNSNRTQSTRTKKDLQFTDQFPSVDDYLAFLRPRFIEMRRLLSSRGSIFVHVDWRTSHHVRLLLDEVFCSEHFLNEIIWHYRSGGRPAPWFARKHDTILWYAREAGQQHTFNRLRDGQYRTQDLRYTDDGQPYKSTRNGPIMFHPDGPACSDVWEIPILSTVSKERTSYPTQKPEKLLERIVRAASNENDVVADFFCGSGTTLAVAKKLSRRYIGCDVNPDAVTITRQRLAAITT